MLQIGDTIRDVEDNDCYYEGIVVNLNPIKYKITNILWNGQIDHLKIGEITELNWWILKIFKGNEWVNLPDYVHKEN